MPESAYRLNLHNGPKVQAILQRYALHKDDDCPATKMQGRLDQAEALIFDLRAKVRMLEERCALLLAVAYANEPTEMIHQGEPS